MEHAFIHYLAGCTQQFRILMGFDELLPSCRVDVVAQGLEKHDGTQDCKNRV